MDNYVISLGSERKVWADSMNAVCSERKFPGTYRIIPFIKSLQPYRQGVFFK